MRKIFITRGAFALVDDEDYERINQHKWALNPEGVGYAVRKGNKRRGEPRTIQMHREILNAPNGIIIDHINGNGLDNRKENLRYATTQKNAFNKRKANAKFTSKYKGVFQRGGEIKWTARIKFNDRHVELGEYTSESYAASVYNFASRLLFGEFRRENVADEIEELSLPEKIRIFNKVKAYVERYGWYVDTDYFRSYFYTTGTSELIKEVAHET